MTNEELIRLHKSHFMRIKKDNPIIRGLLENNKVALYFERSYNEEMNEFIKRECDTLLTTLNYHGISFIYAPMWIKDLDESIGFNIPNCSTSNTGNKLTVDDFYKLIDESLVTPPVLDLPMILVSDPDNEAEYPAEKLEDDKMGLFCYYIEKGMDLLSHYRPQKYPCIFEHPSPIRFQKVDTDDGILFRDGDDEPDVAPQDRADWGDIETLSHEI